MTRCILTKLSMLALPCHHSFYSQVFVWSDVSVRKQKTEQYLIFPPYKNLSFHKLPFIFPFLVKLNIPAQKT